MDSFEKGLLVIGSFAMVLFLAFFAIVAYDGHLRAQMILDAPDPLYAACAYDSSKTVVPASCYTLLSLNKDLPK